MGAWQRVPLSGLFGETECVTFSYMKGEKVPDCLKSVK